MYRVFYKAFHTVLQMVFYKAYIGHVREKQGMGHSTQYLKGIAQGLA